MKPEYLSASRIRGYLTCPLKYRLIYEEKVDWDFHPSSMALGSAVHAAIEGFYREWVDNRRMPVEEVTDLFAGYWKGEVDGKSFEPDCDTNKLGLQGIDLLEAFAGGIQPGKVLSVEEQFRVPLVDRDTGEYVIDLVGVFDLVEADEADQPVVVDHKTAGKRPSDLELDQNLQLSAYGYAVRMLRELGDDPVLLRVDLLIKNKKPVLEQRFTLRGPDQDVKLVRLAGDLLQAMDREVFPPNPGWQCGTCQVRSHCYYQR